MMGKTHGLSGLAAGLALGAAMNASPGVRLLLGGVSLIGAYIPDIDHRKSTITKSIPLLGTLASMILRTTSHAVYEVTKGPRDEPWTGKHRHLTHTVVFALLLGGLVWLAAAHVSQRVGVSDPQELGFLIGLALAVGCVAHCLGDALTIMGCPFLWPIPIAGETWAEIRMPKFLRFRTGKFTEKRIIFPLLTVVTALLIPGVWPIVSPLLLHASHATVEALR